MEFELAMFLSIGAISMSVFLISLIYFSHKQKIKELEVEALKVREANIQIEVKEEIARQFTEYQGRIEVLEAIVTDKNYDLSDKITRLK